MPDEALALDETTRRRDGRVQILNATRPGGLDGWTMDVEQYEAVRRLILDLLENHSDEDGTLLLRQVVEEAQARLGDHPLFPGGRLTNYVRYTKTDMEARCEIERLPGSRPQRITLWRG